MRVASAMCALLTATSLAFADSAGAPTSTPNQSLPTLPPAPPPVLPYSWAGFYVRGSSDLDFSKQSSTPASPGLFSASTATPTSLGGGISNGEIGANWQNGHTVVGFESDMQWSNQSASPLSGCGLGCSLNDRVRVPYFATFRARAGQAFDRLYVYGTGGLSAVGSVDTLDPYSSGSIPNFTDLSAGNLKWTVGWGMEYAVDQDVTAKLEFLYKSPVSGSPDTLFDNNNASIKNDVIRGGLDYRIPLGQ
jgi:outer membrane immunogenic protein